MEEAPWLYTCNALLCSDTALFYAYDGHVYLALHTFSMFAKDDSIFLCFQWIPQRPEAGSAWKALPSHFL
jgi:hypothetical protein